MKTTDVLVIGAGPGGYVCAIRLAQLGKKVVLVEKDKLGGACLNVGCIPSKALIHSAALFYKLRRSEALGLPAVPGAVDWAKSVQWKNSVVAGLCRGVGGLMKSNGVEVLCGSARFTGPDEAAVDGPSGAETVRFAHAAVFTGSRARSLPGLGFDGKLVLSSTEALDLTEVPQRLAVIGGGVIGLEIGMFFAKLGAKLTVIEVLDQLLPGIEPELVGPVARALSRLGAAVHLKSRVLRYSCPELALETPEGEKAVEADRVLLSVGRIPNTEGLGLEAAGVKTDANGFILVSERFQTSAPRIYAAGDVIGPPFLAHKASREARLAALAIAGKETEARGAIPWAVYTDPEIASVGETEAQAKARGADVLVGRFAFSANGRAQTMRAPEGFVKVVAEGADGRILGVAVVGPDASDIIGEAALALRLKAGLRDLANTVHPHPTLCEALQGAAEAALGEAVDLPPPSGSGVRR